MHRTFSALLLAGLSGVRASVARSDPPDPSRAELAYCDQPVSGTNLKKAIRLIRSDGTNVMRVTQTLRWDWGETIE